MSTNFARKINNKVNPKYNNKSKHIKNYSFSSCKGVQDSAMADLLSPKTIEYSTSTTIIYYLLFY